MNSRFDIFSSLLGCFLFAASLSAQIGGGGNLPPGIAGSVTNVSGTSANVTIVYDLNYDVPFSGGPWEPELVIGHKFGSNGIEEVEYWKRIVLSSSKRLQGTHSISFNVKVADGQFYAAFNTDSDVGPNAEFQMFGTYFEVVDGQVVWVPNNDLIGAGGPVVKFPNSVSTNSVCGECPVEMLGANLKRRSKSISNQGDTRQEDASDIGVDTQYLYGPRMTDGSACSSCVASSDEAGGIGLEFVLKSGMENLMMPTGSGLGYGSYLHEEPYLISTDNGIRVRYKDNRFVTSFTEGSAVDGILHDEFGQYKLIRLMKGNTTTPVLADVDKMEVVYFDGSVKTFEVKNDDEDEIGDKYAVMTSWKDANGYGVDYDRSTGVVTGPFGETITISMGATVAGRESIDSIDFGDSVATISYTGFYASQVTVADTATGQTLYRWTNQVSVDPATDAVIWTTSNPASGRKVVTYSPDHGGQDGSVRSYAANKMLSVERGDHGAEELALQLIAYNTIPEEQKIIFGDNFATLDQRHGEWQQYIKENGSPETVYSKNGWNPVNGTVSITPPEKPWVAGAPDFRYEEDGVRVDIEYDEDLFVIKRTWAKDIEINGQSIESFELYQYDALKNVTFYRDRVGNVTTYVYNGIHMTEKHVGQQDLDGDGVVDSPQLPEYGVYRYIYNDGRVSEVRDPLYHSAFPDMHCTKYEYDSSRRLVKVIESPNDSSNPPGETLFTYSSNRVASVTDPMGRSTQFTYDGMGRLIKTTYNDTSTEEVLYGDQDSALFVVATKDRNDVVSTYAYDGLGRRIQSVSAAALDVTILDGVDNLQSDPTKKVVSTTTYMPGLDLQLSESSNGRIVDYTHDYRMRIVSMTRHASAGVALTDRSVYLHNRLFFTEDPFGRKEYLGYREYDGQLLRRIQGTVPAYSKSDNQSVLGQNRDLQPNADFIVTDAIKDHAGQLIQIIDGREILTNVEYDSRGRKVLRVEAFGTNEERMSESIYDLANNLIESRHPRYFDSTDSEGYHQAKSTMTYGGRNLLSSQTEAPGTSEESTTAQTYNVDGRKERMTDARGNDWVTSWHACCGRALSTENPYGHGKIFNNDFRGQTTHYASVRGVSTHSNSHNPTNSWTFNEETVRFDARGRQIANTTWLTALGEVDPQAPSIAGLDGVSVSNGITRQKYFDDNLTDGVGMDAAAGMEIQKLGGGTYFLSLIDCLNIIQTELGVSFSSGNAGQAVVSINGEQEIAVSISDGLGRSIMNARLRPFDSADTPFEVLTYSLVKHPNPATLSGSYVETQAIDALGHVRKIRSDGAGRTIEFEDALQKVSTTKYDANGNVLERLDPQGIGVASVIYDSLNQATQQTDTWGDTIQKSYDKAGNVVSLTDSKGATTQFEYDVKNRKVKTIDRLAGNTTYQYDLNDNVTRMTDAEGQFTRYYYDNRNLHFRTIFPDHSGGSWNSPNWGITETRYDYIGRQLYKYMQDGKVIHYVTDMANRVSEKRYRELGSLWGQVVFTDTFTFDNASRPLSGFKDQYDNTVEMTYDDIGRLETETLKTLEGIDYQVGYDYDAANRRIGIAYPDQSRVSRSYTARNRLKDLNYKGDPVQSRTYGDNGRHTQSSFANGVVSNYGYRDQNGSKDNLLESIANTHPTQSNVGTYTYAYDANKNKTSETISDAGVFNNFGFTTGDQNTDGYDAENRLVDWARDDNQKDQQWSLSLVGDWNSVTDSGASFTRVHEPTHELLSENGNNVETDVKGNITLIPASMRKSGQALAMSWNRDNQLDFWDRDNDGTADMTFEYDAFGRMIKYGTTYRVMSNEQCVALYKNGEFATSPLQKFVFGAYVDEPVMMDLYDAKKRKWNQYYYHQNQQYTVYALTDENGSRVEGYSVNAYGDTTIWNGAGTNELDSSAYANPFIYTGRWYFAGDDDLYYFRARWFDGRIGRFLSRDSLGYIDGKNLYEYYAQLSNTDPTGHQVKGDREVEILGWGSRPTLKFTMRMELDDEPIVIWLEDTELSSEDFDDDNGIWEWGEKISEIALKKLVGKMMAKVISRRAELFATMDIAKMLVMQEFKIELYQDVYYRDRKYCHSWIGTKYWGRWSGTKELTFKVATLAAQNGTAAGSNAIGALIDFDAIIKSAKRQVSSRSRRHARGSVADINRGVVYEDADIDAMGAISKEEYLARFKNEYIRRASEEEGRKVRVYFRERQR